MLPMDDDDKIMLKGFIHSIMNTTLKKHVSKCPPNITDLFFLELEKQYSAEYERIVELYTDRRINPMLGRYVKKEWDLENLDRCNNPKSKYIKSYRQLTN